MSSPLRGNVHMASDIASPCRCFTINGRWQKGYCGLCQRQITTPPAVAARVDRFKRATSTINENGDAAATPDPAIAADIAWRGDALSRRRDIPGGIPGRPLPRLITNRLKKNAPLHPPQF